MANELVKIEKVTDKDLLAHLDNLGLTKDLTAGEKNTYLQIAQAFNLNPFKREIHVSKYNGQMSIITGYEVYIKRAERSGLLDGWVVATSGSVADGSLKAIITIYRKDRQHPFVWEVLYSEYVQTVKDSATNTYRPNKFWQKAETMTKKVAMAQGFRLCFNDELGGMPYTSEELNDMPETTTPANIVPTPPDAKGQKATPIIKKPCTQKAIDKAVARINDGEAGICEGMADAFELTPEQTKQLEEAQTAYDNQNNQPAQ